jgi:uncharacterized protein (UPF0210 family)
VQKGYQKSDKFLTHSLPQALGKTDFVCASVNVGSTKSGINMDAVRSMGEIIKKIAEISKTGCTKKVKGASFDVVAKTLKKTAFKISRMRQLIGRLAIVDLSLASTPAYLGLCSSYFRRDKFRASRSAWHNNSFSFAI